MNRSGFVVIFLGISLLVVGCEQSSDKSPAGGLGGQNAGQTPFGTKPLPRLPGLEPGTVPPPPPLEERKLPVEGMTPPAVESAPPKPLPRLPSLEPGSVPPPSPLEERKLPVEEVKPATEQKPAAESSGTKSLPRLPPLEALPATTPAPAEKGAAEKKEPATEKPAAEEKTPAAEEKT